MRRSLAGRAGGPRRAPTARSTKSQTELETGAPAGRGRRPGGDRRRARARRAPGAGRQADPAAGRRGRRQPGAQPAPAGLRGAAPAGARRRSRAHPDRRAPARHAGAPRGPDREADRGRGSGPANSRPSLAAAAERAELAEAENRTHQMSEALREMREHDVATTRDATTQREISAATSAAIEAGALEDRRAASPLLKELSMDAKKSLAKIDGITKLHEAQEGREGSGAADEAARHATRDDSTTRSATSPTPRSSRNGTVELAIKRTDMEALINRVVEESGADADNDIRVVADALRLRIDASRTEQIMAGLLRSRQRANAERQDDRRPPAAGRRRRALSVEDPGEASETAISPVVRRFAEIQGGWIKAEAHRRWRRRVPRVPARRCRHRRPGRAPALQITVDEPRAGPSRTERRGRPRPRTRSSRRSSVAFARCRATRSR